MIHERDVLRRVAELGTALRTRFPEEPPTLVAVMEGARVFADHLAAHFPGTPVFGMRAASYGNGLASSGTVQLEIPGDLPVRGRSIVLIEDIVDTGRTVRAVVQALEERGAREVVVVALLSKPARRVVPVRIDLVGFEIEDEFVVGFGMDAAGRYRGLRDIVIYDAAREVTA
jgi:hypoxanthine phosphoribosyltransferase